MGLLQKGHKRRRILSRVSRCSRMRKKGHQRRHLSRKRREPEKDQNPRERFLTIKRDQNRVVEAMPLGQEM